MVNNDADDSSAMKLSGIALSTKGLTPANKKFNVVIRLLHVQSAPAWILAQNAKALEPFYGGYEGVETITLCIVGAEQEKTSFVVPKLDLVRTSPVFQRMLASEMTEKALGKVVIEDTNPEEFGDFLKAISPKPEQPNRGFNTIRDSNIVHIISSFKCIRLAQIGRSLPLPIAARPL
jgi:hypothetical protein